LVRIGTVHYVLSLKRESTVRTFAAALPYVQYVPKVRKSTFITLNFWPVSDQSP